jgi:Leucine-rich repeat (LRR) protein
MVECKKTGAPTLDLSGIGIERVPEELAAFTWLTELDLRYNDLTVLPDSIGNLTCLTKLDLSRNGSSSFLFRRIFGRLSHLDLSFISLTKIPETIGNLTGLRLNRNDPREDSRLIKW